MPKKGYVIYNLESSIYPAKLLLENPDMPKIDVAFKHIRDNYNMFSEYKDFELKGPMQDEINLVMDALFVPRREDITVGMYVFPTNDLVDVRDTIPVLRNIYYILDVGNGFYQLTDIVKTYSGRERLEVYHVFVSDGILLYQGKMGNFYLRNSVDENFPRIDILLKGKSTE